MHLKKRSKLRLRTVVIFPKISDIFKYHCHGAFFG